MVVSGGLLDDAPAAPRAVDQLAGEGGDLVFCYAGPYSMSSKVLLVVQRAKVPVVLLNLQPRAAEGESLEGERVRIGNTNSRLRFAMPPAEFLNAWCAQGPTHHCALGIGRFAHELEKIAALFQMDLKVVGHEPS